MRKTNALNKVTKQSGLTIIELMVDIVLSVFVIGILVSFYINYKRSNAVQFDHLLINNSASAAFQYINNDLQLIGFYGCNSDASSIEYALTPSFDYELSDPITPFDANQTGLNSTFSLSNPSIGWSPSFQGQMADISPDDGSDAFTIRFADTNPTAVLQTTSSGSSLVIDTPVYSIADGDILLISDCSRTVLFEVNSYSSNTITPTQSIGTMNAGAEIYKLNVNSYYIKTEDGISSLYKYSNNTETLLVPNIENMQIMYGQDTTGDGVTNKFYTGSEIEDKPITSLEIGLIIKSNNQHNQQQTDSQHLLLSSPDAISTTITVNTPSDNYIRRTYDFYITLENV